MIFAVSMTFIDQTIVAIAVPEPPGRPPALRDRRAVDHQRLPALALGAVRLRRPARRHRRPPTHGRARRRRLRHRLRALRRDPDRQSLDEAWIDHLPRDPGRRRGDHVPGGAGDRPRRLPGRTSAAARWRSSSAIAGGLTAIGPIAGGYLAEWTWRAIFWVNIPVAIIALVLTCESKPDNTKHPAPLDYRGTVLIAGGMGLAVLGLQQSSVWGWGSPTTWGCIAAGPGPARRLRARTSCGIENPLMRLRDLREPRLRGRQRGPLPADDRLRPAVLLRQHVRADLARRKRLGNRPLPADLLRRLRDRLAVRRPDPRPRRGAPGGGAGCAVAAVGFFLWARRCPTSRSATSGTTSSSPEPASAWSSARPTPTPLNRVPQDRYGEATGITQTVRNFGSSLGLARARHDPDRRRTSRTSSRRCRRSGSRPRRPTRSPTRSAAPAAARPRGSFSEHAGARGAEALRSASSTTSRWPPARSSTGWRW